MQVWIIPIADERVGVQVKLWNPSRTRAIPERFCGGDSLRRGAISSVCTLHRPAITVLCSVYYGMTVGCNVWTSHANTSVSSNKRESASTLYLCQKLCYCHPFCTGLDWAADRPLNQRCSLTGPWSGTRNYGTAPGVTHIDRVYTCSRRGDLLLYM